MFELIVAMDEMGGIAKDGNIPWHCPEDLRFFKQKTEYNIVIMGRKTFETLPNGPLKNRLNIVLTSTFKEKMASNTLNNVIYTDNADWIADFIPFKDKYPFLSPNPTKFVMGGLEIYNLFFAECKQFWITTIKGNYGCDVFFRLKTNEAYSVVVKEDEFIKVVCLSANFVRRMGK